VLRVSAEMTVYQRMNHDLLPQLGPAWCLYDSTFLPEGPGFEPGSPHDSMCQRVASGSFYVVTTLCCTTEYQRLSLWWHNDGTNIRS